MRAVQLIERVLDAERPGFVFFRVPLRGFRRLRFGSPTGSTQEAHAAAVVEHGTVGERDEREHTARFDPGLLHAAPEHGDVEGVSCGHDHVDDCTGNHVGSQLGDGPGTAVVAGGSRPADGGALPVSRSFWPCRPTSPSPTSPPPDRTSRTWSATTSVP
ncbi:hypothetical protein AB2L28_09875 [Kineococcus sp. TBRC 1896]|uniref:Uncharacterized protein n=1 Tax=Kineococcus mangrovi TaxID=1660183 RepID=A0ABV4I1J3_9ACTN